MAEPPQPWAAKKKKKRILENVKTNSQFILLYSFVLISKVFPNIYCPENRKIADLIFPLLHVRDVINIPR